MWSKGKVVSALKKLGFSIIEETAVGAEIVSELYNEYIEDNKQDVYITTACPSANYLVEKYFKEIIPYLDSYGISNDSSWKITKG